MVEYCDVGVCSDVDGRHDDVVVYCKRKARKERWSVSIKRKEDALKVAGVGDEDMTSTWFSSGISEVVACARNWVSGQGVDDITGRAVCHNEPFR